MRSKIILPLVLLGMSHYSTFAHEHPIAHVHTQSGADFSPGIVVYFVLASALVSFICWNLFFKKNKGGNECKLEKESS